MTESYQKYKMNELTKCVISMNHKRAKELVQQGEDINEPYNELGWTPFHLMVCKYHPVEVVEEFIKLKISKAQNKSRKVDD